MLNNEQCIKIAEKVWGWTYYPRKERISGIITNEHFEDTNLRAHFISDVSIKDQILSWQGFGRTAEAMAERGYWPVIVGEYVDFCKQGQSWSDAVSRYKPKNIKLIIENLHLAALEAIK